MDIEQLKKRFEAHTERIPGVDCHIWMASVTRKGGHGRTFGFGRQMLAHRLAYQLYRGPIPNGMLVCHRCDVPSCVNPDHLFIGTHKDNIADCIQKDRRRDQRGEKNNLAKLTKQTVLSIRKANGSQYEIARKFGVSRSNVGLIRQGKTWKHLLD
jgi:predicted XRE-type DNA-binding protein